MSRVETILSSVRTTLADPNKTRWTDDALLQFLTDAQSELAEKCRLIKRTIEIPVFANQDTYSLPNDVIAVERVYYDGKPLRLIDYKVIDSLTIRKSSNSPLYVVFNKHPRLQIQVFPAPTQDSQEQYLSLDSDLIGIASEVENMQIPESYGIITDIIGKNIEVESDSNYGIITDIKQVVNILEVYYHALPAAVTSLDSELEVAPACDKALKYHIIMNAYLADSDAQNRSSAAVYANIYDTAAKAILQDASQDYMSEITQVETNYMNGVFEWPLR